MFISPLDEVEKLHKRYCGDEGPWCVLRFGSSRESGAWLDPGAFLSIVDLLESRSFVEMGGITDRGFDRFVGVADKVRALLAGEQASIWFTQE